MYSCLSSACGRAMVAVYRESWTWASYRNNFVCFEYFSWQYACNCWRGKCKLSTCFLLSHYIFFLKIFISTVRTIRTRYLNICFYLLSQKPMVFESLGSLLAHLVPRCTDPLVRVRQTAIECIQKVLRVSLRYEGLILWTVVDYLKRKVSL